MSLTLIGMLMCLYFYTSCMHSFYCRRYFLCLSLPDSLCRNCY